MKRTMGICLAVLLLVVGCVQKSNDDEDNPPEESAKHVWSGQVQALDKARGVEQTLMQSARQQGGEIDKQSQ